MAEGKKLIEGFWDCEYCESKGISGLKRDCPFCGKPRGDHVKFYMKKVEQQTYLSEEQANKVSGSPDWYCEYCGSLNPSSAKFCTSCGAEREDGGKDYYDIQKENEIKAAKKAEEKREMEKVYAPPKKSGPGKYIFLGILALLIAFIVYTIIPKKDSLSVNAFAWKYTINLEEEKEVEESDWSLPVDGRLITTKEEVHHYDSVVDHYEDVVDYKDAGNGTFEEVTHQEPIYRKDPVYETKYYYFINRWFDGRQIITEGDDHVPYWGDVDLADNEREKSRDELYEITAVNKKGKENTYILSKEDWDSLEIGDKIEVKVSGGKKASIIK